MNPHTDQPADTPSYDDRPDSPWRLDGRISRARWWWAYVLPSLALVAVLYVQELILSYLDGVLGNSQNIPLLLLNLLVVLPTGMFVNLGFLLFYWLLIVGTVKRIHDHDCSGWWVLFPLSLSIAGGLLDRLEMLPRILQFADPINLTLGLFTLVLFGFLRGTRGPNRFGPDPVAQLGAGRL
jgi:uncharacterized membrane protein YhaH (DUF805 family)